MEKKINYIVREVPPEQSDFSFYFDNDGLKESSGDYCYNLFIVAQSRNRGGFNEKEYKHIQDEAERILGGFSDVSDKWLNGYNSYETYKEAMESNGIVYNPHKCHALKEWAKTADINDTGSIAEYLTISTGHKWETSSARGYFQGDYVEMVYCPEHYKNGVKQYGEIWLGAGKEFYTIELEENGEETNTCYGYIIADCQARTDEDYKRLVCEWAGISEDETQLEMIEDSRTYTKYNYRTA